MSTDAAAATTNDKKDDSATPASSGQGRVVTFYEDLENLKKLCNFLRTREGPPVREALLMEKRVHYLKGKILLRRERDRA
jgi:hypothetical protein